MSSVSSNMERVVRATIDGFNSWDYSALWATRSNDFIYQFLPTTLNAPPRNNDEYAEFWTTQMTPLFSAFKVTPTTIVHDAEARRSVMFGVADVETVIGDKQIEFVMMLSFNDAADKITRIDEFFDSLMYTTFFAKVAEMQAGAGSV